MDLLNDDFDYSEEYLSSIFNVGSSSSPVTRPDEYPSCRTPQQQQQQQQQPHVQQELQLQFYPSLDEDNTGAVEDEVLLDPELTFEPEIVLESESDQQGVFTQLTDGLNDDDAQSSLWDRHNQEEMGRKLEREKQLRNSYRKATRSKLFYMRKRMIQCIFQAAKRHGQQITKQNAMNLSEKLLRMKSHRFICFDEEVCKMTRIGLTNSELSLLQWTLLPDMEQTALATYLNEPVALNSVNEECWEIALKAMLNLIKTRAPLSFQLNLLTRILLDRRNQLIY